mgnify:CR=1 FL=1
MKNGGLITKTINTPTTSSASGVWSLQEQYEAETNNAWPKYYSTSLSDPQSFNLSNISSTPSNTRLRWDQRYGKILCRETTQG